ncbi:MAG: small ribosomal subunit Rsm22 family protein [Candidatus Paracaedibacteraceae bacterium]|nr:small ribosomal subunit Rsm22 family protein [Candidatus Paracaedibacteraceae bacterium]
MACMDRFNDISSVLIEENADMVRLGQQLIPSGQWKQHNILALPSFPKADLVLFSYVLNEIHAAQQLEMVAKLWAATTDYLLILTPGTPQSFAQLKTVRHYLIGQGAHIVAPLSACTYMSDGWTRLVPFYPKTESFKSP